MTALGSVSRILLCMCFLISTANGALHPKMGISHVLERPGSPRLKDQKPSYPEEPFEASPSYEKLRSFSEELKDTMGTTQEAEKVARLQKILETTEISLIHLSLQDREHYIRRNKPHMKSAKAENKFHPLNARAAGAGSGALLWAHRHGILGKGADVFVMERVGAVNPDSTWGKVIKSTEDFVDPRHDPAGLRHAEDVVSVVYQMAPQANITLMRDYKLEIFFDPEWQSESFHSYRETKIFPDHPFILNFSGGAVSKDRIGGFKGFFESRYDKGDLLVKAVPNSAGFFGDTEVDRIFNEEVFNQYSAHIILVGNLDEYGHLEVNPFNDLQSSRFLCAYGGDVLTEETRAVTGTSFAAPTVSGAVALVKSKYPQLTLIQIGNILLESADTTFWINLEGWKPTLVYNPEDFPEGPAAVLKLPPNVTWEPFSPRYYGRGVLNLRRAFLLAKLLAENPGRGFSDLMPLFKKAVEAQENEAALKIQTAFRKYRERKKT